VPFKCENPDQTSVYQMIAENIYLNFKSEHANSENYFSVLNTSTQHKLNYCKTANFENVDIPIEESPFR